MRIGIFSDTYTPQTSGVVFVIEIFRRNMLKLGHEVIIFAPKPIGFKEKDPNVVRFSALPGVLAYDDYLTSIFFPPIELRRIKKEKLDIVFMLTPSQIGLLGAAAAKKFNLPLVTQYSTDLFEYITLYPEVLLGSIALIGIASISIKAKPREVMKLARDTRHHRKQMPFSQSLVRNSITMLHNSCDAVISLSRKKQQQMIDWGIHTRLEMIPTGVDALPVSKEAAGLRAKLGIAEDDKVVLFAGRIAAEKNLDLLVDSFDQLVSLVPKARLVFVGDFEYRPVLEKKASCIQNASKVIFTGRIPHEKLGDYYAMANVFAFPSLTDTQGLVIHEAALAGLPLVLVDTEVSELLIPGKTGFYARNNPNSMAKTIAKILNMSDDSYQQMSRNAKKQASKFSELSQTKKIIKLFEELIEAKKNQPTHK